MYIDIKKSLGRDSVDSKRHTGNTSVSENRERLSAQRIRNFTNDKLPILALPKPKQTRTNIYGNVENPNPFGRSQPGSISKKAKLDMSKYLDILLSEIRYL